MELKNFIKLYENVLDTDVCKKIVDKVDHSKFQSALISNEKELSKYYRNCYEQLLNKEFEQTIFESIGKILSFYVKDFSFFSQTVEGIDTGYTHLLYKGGEKGEYKTHVDHMKTFPRVLSISILLNNNFEGGDFCFFDEYVIEKKVGSAVVFPSSFMFPHGVLPVSNGDRHAIITWVR